MKEYARSEEVEMQDAISLEKFSYDVGGEAAQGGGSEKIRDSRTVSKGNISGLVTHTS